MEVLYLVLSIVFIIVLTAKLNIHPFLSLFFVAILYGFAVGMPAQTILTSINEGFGSTIGTIGILIVFGVVMGAFLEHSGAAYTMANAILKLTGRKKVPVAMGVIGYFVSIPVFADSGFLLLSPLNKSLTKKAGLSLACTAVALGIGLTATHTMVPPTPGPIAAAGILGADIGLVILIGVPVSAISLTAGLIFAIKVASKTYIDPNPEVSEDEIEEKLKKAPGLFKSSFPVIFPIILIVLNSIAKYYQESLNETILGIVNFIGAPVIALLIGTLLSFLLPKKFNLEMLSTKGWVGTALKDAATIILITGAGGIFGKVLQNSGLSDVIGSTLSGYNISILLPFLLAAALKSAQGSSTVALITTASIMVPLMGDLGFETEIQKAIVVIAIGAGSSVVSHANDSFFWVLTQMTNMEVKTGYKLFSLGTLILGSTAAVSLLIINFILN